MNDIDLTKMGSSVPKFLAIAIDKAYNTSDRAGIGWLLTYNNKIATLNGGFSGNIDINELRQYRQLNDESELFLSCPPYPLFLNIKELEKLVIDLNITKINFPKLNKKLRMALKISEMKKIDNCEIKVHNVSQISERIYGGPISLLNKKRPWTRCLIGSTMSGNNLSLEHFFSEFGVKSYIIEKFAQSTSIAFESDFKLNNIDLHQNSRNITISQYQVSNIKDVQKLHDQLQRLSSPVLTMVCSFELFSQLMSLDLVDECICHISMLNIPSEHSTHSYLLPKIELEKWEITESIALTKGIRIHLNRGIFQKKPTHYH